MATKRKFDADKQTSELTEAEVTLEGHAYHPVRLDPETRKEQVRISMEAAAAIRESGITVGENGNLTVTDPEKSLQVIENSDAAVRDQLALLLADTEGVPPPPELLARLDVRVAANLLGWLMEDDEGNASTPAAPNTPATTTA